MSEPIVKIKGLISFKDVLNFSYESTAQSYLLVSIFMLVLLYSDIMRVGIWLFLVLLLLLAGSFFLAMRFFARKNFTADRTFQDEVAYDFTTEGISITTRNGSSSVSWDKIHQVIVSKNLITIYLAKKQAFLLPVSWFANPGELDEFKKTLLTYLPMNKIKQKSFYVF